MHTGAAGAQPFALAAGETATVEANPNTVTATSTESGRRTRLMAVCFTIHADVDSTQWSVHLDPVVECVGNVDVPGGVERDRLGKVEPTSKCCQQRA